MWRDKLHTVAGPRQQFLQAAGLEAEVDLRVVLLAIRAPAAVAAEIAVLVVHRVLRVPVAAAVLRVERKIDILAQVAGHFAFRQREFRRRAPRNLVNARQSVFFRRQKIRREFRRGFSILPGERVLLVDDILTTGGSLMAMIPAVEKLGGEIVGCVVLVDRGGGHETLTSPATGRSYPLRALWRLDLPTYEPGAATCPRCAAGDPLKVPGSTGTASTATGT